LATDLFPTWQNTSDAATVDRFCAVLREHLLANRNCNINSATEEVTDDA
jgi:hypothetical protein